MKKDVIVVKPHSFIDVITNSSTELFVGNSDKSEGFIREIIQDFLNILDRCSGSEDKYELDDIMTIYRVDKSNVERVADTLLDWKSIPWNIPVERFDPPDYYYTNMQSYNKFKLEEEDYISKWKEKNFQTLKDNLINSIVIHGTYDNSIPYELFDIIQYKLLSNAERIHQG